MEKQYQSASYSADELKVMRQLFMSFDHDGSGMIHINQLPGLLGKLGKTDDEVVSMTERASKIAYEQEGQMTFEDFAQVLEEFEDAPRAPAEGPDAKVMEFLRILEEYRVKCEEEGNYLEAGRANKQLNVLRKQEEVRQQKAVLARQLAERQDVQLAHNMQFSDFNSAWDKYMEEYDGMAQMYIQQMTERHALVLLEYQKQLRHELAGKPPKWSKELLETRRKQHILARNKEYAEAEKLKKVSDKVEASERKAMERDQAVQFARREAKYRLQQQAELSALLKRIEVRRREHIKQRNLDSKRLLQRNRNVQAVLEAKQTAESSKLFLDIKKSLHTSSFLGPKETPGSSNPGLGATTKGRIAGTKTGQGGGGGRAYGESGYQEQDEGVGEGAGEYEVGMQEEEEEAPFEPAFMTNQGPEFGKNYDEEEEE
jgi:hypothetical protein